MLPAALAVIVALPLPTAVIVILLPDVLDILILEELLVDQVTPLLVALDGPTVADNALAPISTEFEPVIDIDVGRIVGTVTVSALDTPSTVTVTVVVPAATGVTVILLFVLSTETVAIDVFAEEAVTVLFSAVAGNISTFNVLAEDVDMLVTVVVPSFRLTV